MFVFVVITSINQFELTLTKEGCLITLCIFQIALRELDENRKSAVDKLKDNIEKEGLDAAFKHFREDLDNWKNEPVKLALTGKSGVGSLLLSIQFAI